MLVDSMLVTSMFDRDAFQQRFLAIGAEMAKYSEFSTLMYYSDKAKFRFRNNGSLESTKPTELDQYGLESPNARERLKRDMQSIMFYLTDPHGKDSRTPKPFRTTPEFQQAMMSYQSATRDEVLPETWDTFKPAVTRKLIAGIPSQSVENYKGGDIEKRVWKNLEAVVTAMTHSRVAGENAATVDDRWLHITGGRSNFDLPKGGETVAASVGQVQILTRFMYLFHAALEYSKAKERRVKSANHWSDRCFTIDMAHCPIPQNQEDADRILAMAQAQLDVCRAAEAVKAFNSSAKLPTRTITEGYSDEREGSSPGYDSIGLFYHSCMENFDDDTDRKFWEDKTQAYLDGTKVVLNEWDALEDFYLLVQAALA